MLYRFLVSMRLELILNSSKKFRLKLLFCFPNEIIGFRIVEVSYELMLILTIWILINVQCLIMYRMHLKAVIVVIIKAQWYVLLLFYFNKILLFV
jgi:hypothetical protein